MSNANDQNSIRCPSCGKYCRDGLRFCIYCGTSLNQPDDTHQEHTDLKDDSSHSNDKKRLKILFIAMAVCIVILLGILIAVLSKNGKTDYSVKENEMPKTAETASDTSNRAKNNETEKSGDSIISEEERAEREREEKYKSASAMMERGEYENAIDAFRSLNGYKDSAEQINKCKKEIEKETNEKEYKAAIDLLESGEYYKAYDAFSKLNGYRDSMEMADALKAGKLVISGNTPPFSLNTSELRQEILLIRDYFYNPTSEVTVLTKEFGSDELQYRREYYLLNGRLFFAFLYNGEDQHRLYFKDNNLIRYIGPDHVEHDYPNIDQYESWACLARREVYFGEITVEQEAVEGDRSKPDAAFDQNNWLGCWKSSRGEIWEIIKVSDTITATHHTMDASGDNEIKAEYKLVFLSEDLRMIGEDPSVPRDFNYSFEYNDQYILVHSRYPDEKFYRE